MNPTNDNQVPAMELPGVPPEASNGDSEASDATANTEKAAVTALEQGVSQSAPATPVDDQVTNLGPQPAVATSFDPTQILQQAQTSAQPQHQMPAIADDNDLIEKEWVDKAKQIVGHTKNDPHTQNKEMNKMKADYLKKRYNKEVKLVEE